MRLNSNNIIFKFLSRLKELGWDEAKIQSRSCLEFSITMIAIYQFEELAALREEAVGGILRK
jgi:hypothetical protein